MRLIKVLLAVTSLFLLTNCGDKDHSPTVSAPEEEEDVATQANHEGWDLSQVVTLDKVRDMADGTPLFIHTAYGDTVNYALELVRVVNDFMPPEALIMVEVTDERLIAVGGVFHGMSGLPIVTKDGRKIGALSYGFSEQNHPPFFFFATPIGYMVDGIFRPGTMMPSAKLAKVKVDGRTLKPLVIPLVGTGVSQRLVAEIIRRGYNRTGGFLSLESFSSAASMAREESGQQKFVPGSPLAVGLVLGPEVIMGALGSTTMVSPYGHIIGFGHPFYNVWETGGWPIIGAEVLAKISSLFDPYLFATLDPTIYGAIEFDGKFGIGGNLGIRPAMIPLKLNLTLPDGQVVRLEHSIVRSGLESQEQGYLSAAALLSPVEFRLPEGGRRSFKVGTRMSFENSNQEINNQRLYADGDYEPAFSQTLYAYMDIWSKMSGSQSGVKPKNIELTIEVVDSLLMGKITHLAADTSFTSGTTLGVQVTLRVNQGLAPDRIETLELALPDSLPAGVYALHVGSADDPDMADDLIPPGERTGLQADTSATDEGKTWDELLKEINQEDQSTMLKARLILARLDIDSVAVAAPDTAIVPPNYGLDPMPTLPPPQPPTGSTPVVPSVTLQTGLVIEGHRMMEVHITK